MMEQVELLKKNGDAAGLVRFFLDQDAETGKLRERGQILQAKGEAAKAVAEMGTPQAVDALIRGLETSPDPQAYMLGNAAATIGSPKAVKELMRLARKHESPQVRNAAVTGLAGHIDGFGDLRGEVFDVLSSAVDDPEVLVRLGVGQKLRSEDPRTLDLLIRLVGDANPGIRYVAANGLRARQEPQAQEALRGLAADPDENVRKVVAAAGIKVSAAGARTPGGAVAPKLDTPAMVWIGVLLLAAFVPAAYLGGEVAKALSRATSGPIGGVMVVAVGGIVLGILGAIAYSVGTKWRGALPSVVGAGAVALAGLSTWMLISVRDAGESVLVFLISAVVLAVIAVFIKLFGSQ